MNDHKAFWKSVGDYDRNVFSVFADKKAENPIFEYLEKKRKESVVADYGCGPGNFLPFLSEIFYNVVAVDYSKEMLSIAQNNNKQAKNIAYKEMDLTSLGDLYSNVDIAICVNSILPRTINEVDLIISEVYKTIRTGGEFVGILPAADTVFHLALLNYQKLLDDKVNEDEIEKMIEKEFMEERQTSILGFCRDNPESPRQKYFFPFEIEWRLKKAGFNSIQLKKVYYSWDFCKNHDYGYFPEHERIWDWFVVAKKG